MAGTFDQVTGESEVPRVLVDLSVAPAGGAATYTSGFADGLLRWQGEDREKVVVLLDRAWSTSRPEVARDLRASGVTVVEEMFPPPGSWKARLVRGRIIARVVREHSVDVAFFPRDVAPRLRVPTVVLLNNRYAWASFATGQAIGGRVPATLLRVMAWATARRAGGVLAVSQAMADAARGVRVDGVVHHGCSLPAHRRPTEDREEGGPVSVLMVANLIENKQVETVVEGVAEAQRRGGQWALRVHGTRMDETYAQGVEVLSRRLFGHSVVEAPVYGPDLEQAYQQADILVVGGTFESFCHPLVEGMRSGCVVVAPDSPLVHEICQGVAVTYRDGDPVDLARALQVAGRELDQRAKAGVERSLDFDWVTTVDTTLAEVRSVRSAVLAGRPAAVVGAGEGHDRARIMVGLSVAPPGGAATYVEGLATGLVEADIANKDQLVVVFDQRWATEHRELVDRARAAGLTVVARSFPEPGSWQARLGRGRLLRNLAVEHQVQAAFVPRELAPAMGVPVVVLARNLSAWRPYASGAAIGGRVPAFLLRVMAKRSARRATMVLAVSRQMAQMVVGAPVAAVVHHGCSLPEFERDLLAEPPASTLVLTVGNLIENKGLDTIVEAVGLLDQQHPGGFDLRVHGKRTDIAYADRIEALSRRLLGRSVLLGPAYGSDLVKAYQGSHIVVVGSTFESFCHPLVEAMRSGCVVVAPESVLVADICGDVAVTYHEGDPASLARAILVARGELNERSRAGVERSRRFSWADTASRTVDLVRSVALVSPAR